MKILSNHLERIFKGFTNQTEVRRQQPCFGMRISLLLISCCLLSSPLSAQTEAPPPPPIREPLPPKVLEPEDPLDQEVVIRQEEGRTVEEYRRNGQVHMVRIVPDIGQPYYLIDTTGDGLLDMKHDTFEPVKPVYWRLFEW